MGTPSIMKIIIRRERITLDQARRAAVLLDREYAGEQRADDAADRVLQLGAATTQSTDRTIPDPSPAFEGAVIYH